MKYLVNPVNIENDFMWEVHEVNTEHVIDRFYFEEDAARCAAFMENGGGFDGWTPSFILRQVEIDKNINLKFNLMFED